MAVAGRVGRFSDREALHSDKNAEGPDHAAT